MTTSAEAIKEAVHLVLAAGRPMTEDQLMDALLALDVDLGDEPEQWLDYLLDAEELDLVFDLADERLVLLPALLNDRVLTHRLTDAECSNDALVLAPDFIPMLTLLEEDKFLHLADGSPIEVTATCTCVDHEMHAGRNIPDGDLPAGGAVLLPVGHLDRLGLHAGDLAGLRFTQSGFELLHVDPASELQDGTELTDRLDDVLDERFDQDSPMGLDMAVWNAIADSELMFKDPTCPLGELLDAAGFAHDDDWIAPAGFDFDNWMVRRHVASIQREHNVSAEDAHIVAALSLLFNAAGEEGADNMGSDQGLIRALVRNFTEPALAQALVAEAIGNEYEGAQELAVFAESLESHAPRAALANLRWVGAKAHERLGEILTAERLLKEALDVDSDHIAALNDLARYSGDRGDSTSGLAYLRRAGEAGDEELVNLFEYYQSAAGKDLGSKEPCWCGSGRKYKRCHLGKELAPLSERVDWLAQKAGRYLSDGPWHAEILLVAQIRSLHWDSPKAIELALRDPLVADLVTFEGGAFDQFLTERGVLLPEDEWLLGQQWVLIERSVYEIEAVRPGAGFDVRDLRTGDRQQVQERSGSMQLQVGDLVCVRLLPAGDSIQVFGGIEPVALHQRDALMELLDSGPDPLALVEFLSARFAPPVLQNTEGEPMVICEATLHIPDPAALTAELDEQYERSGVPGDQRPVDSIADGCESGAVEWIENVETHGMTRIRAMLLLSGHELTIETNSERRLDRVLDLVSKTAPQAQIVSESRTPLDQLPSLIDRGDPGDGDLTGDQDEDDPQVQEMLAKMMREYEQRWLDESIPALSGVTPREAAADPTRREDLVRLLDSFPHGRGPASMDPDRLKAALELT